MASVVTSTLLAGLGFSGGVISSFPSSVWPSRASNHYPTSTHQTNGPTKPTKDATTSASAVTTTVAKNNSDMGGEDREHSRVQGEDGEKEGEDKDEEKEEEEDEKRERKGSGNVGKAGRKDTSAGNEPPSETPDSTTKEMKQIEHLVKMTPGVDEQLEVYTILLESNPITTTEAAYETAALPAPKNPAVTLRFRTGRDKKHWPFSTHTGESTNLLKINVNMSVVTLYEQEKWEFVE